MLTEPASEKNNEISGEIIKDGKLLGNNIYDRAYSTINETYDKIGNALDIIMPFGWIRIQRSFLVCAS